MKLRLNFFQLTECKEYESITQIPFYVKSHPSFPASTVLEDKCLRNGAPLIKGKLFFFYRSSLLVGGHLATMKNLCPVIKSFTGGEEALIHEFPHQALLGYMKQKVHWSCGGSLISPNFILTGN